MKRLIILPLLAVACAASAQTIVWDQGVGTGTIWESGIQNEVDLQNLTDSIRFTQDTFVNYFVTYNNEPTNGPDYIFRVYGDTNGHPGSVLYFTTLGSLNATIIGQDQQGTSVYQHDLTFGNASYTFLANTTYWVGAPTNGGLLASATSIRSPGDGRFAPMFGTTFQHFVSDHDIGGGDMMFRLGAVPEPASLAPLALGALLLASRRKKK